MESSIKNFETVVSDLVQNRVATKRFLIRRRTLHETLYAIALASFTLGFAADWALGFNPWLMFALTGATLAAILVYLRQSDYLTVDRGGKVRYVNDWVLGRKAVTFSKQAIEFVGIGSGEKFSDVGTRHVVYIQQAGQLIRLRQFVVGREAVILAKEVRQFLGL